MASRRRNNRRRGGHYDAAEMQRIFPKDHVVHVVQKDPDVDAGLGVGWVMQVGGYLQSEDWNGTSIPEGQAVVQWLGDVVPRVEEVAGLRPVERPLLPGCRVQYRGALGAVTAVDRTALVVMSESGAEINIPVRKLRPAGSWRYGDFVHDTSTHSVGRVLDVRHLVEVDSPSGKCTFFATFNETEFSPASVADYPSPNELFKHFPGQAIVADHEAWNMATWTKGAAPQTPQKLYYNNLYVARHPQGTVSRCVPVSVKVLWVARVGPGADEEWVVPERIKTVPWMWEDGYFPRDHVVEIKNGQLGVVKRITSRVDVRFSDGSSLCLRGIDLTPCQPLPNTFLPPNHVLRNSERGIERGVIRRAQPEESTCDVYWFDVDVEERVSYYELKQDHVSDIFYADTVIRIDVSDAGGPPDVGVIRALTDNGEVKVEWTAPQKKASVHQVSELIVLYKDDWSGGELSSGQEDSQSSGQASNEQAAEAQQQSQGSLRTSSEASTRGGSPDRSTKGSSDADDFTPELLDELTDVPLDDHRFSSTPPAELHPSVLRRELKILERGLPEDGSILVRTYPSRTDLLRVLLFGPQDSPYANVPFVFDVSLPESYPHAPPRVLAHPLWGDERLNPNLHADGKVCLSLLGTWEGPGWQPRVSTLLQVLLSIQALVLVHQPYFNEPGYEAQRGSAEGQRNSRSYNEFARLLSLEALVAAARRPVLGLVKELEYHFKRVGPGVLEEAQRQARGECEGFSAGFSMAMQRFQPRLEAALRSFNSGGEASPRQPRPPNAGRGTNLRRSTGG
jgi:ubiquitin-conjugating enzyme E2 O